MAKKLKRRKSSILKSMNPDFVNKLSCIMGGAAAAQEAKNNKNTKKSIGGRSNAGGKNTPSKPKYPPLPPPMPIPVPKPSKVKKDVKPLTPPPPPIKIPEQISKNIEEPLTSLPHKHGLHNESNTNVEKNVNIENNTNINTDYFSTLRDIVGLSYENNKFFLENGLKYIVQHREEISQPPPTVRRDEEPRFKITYGEIKNVAFGFFLGVLFSYVL